MTPAVQYSRIVLSSPYNLNPRAPERSIHGRRAPTRLPSPRSPARYRPTTLDRAANCHCFLGGASRRNHHIHLDIEASDSTILKSRSKTKGRVTSCSRFRMSRNAFGRAMTTGLKRTRRRHLEIHAMNANRECDRRAFLDSSSCLPSCQRGEP
jgi:hypothetical protein